MGVREEIKRLADCRYRAIRRINAICGRCEWVDDYGCFYADPKGTVMASYLGNELATLYKVLSILDEHLGECETEGEYRLTGDGLRWLNVMVGDEVLWKLLQDRGMKPGDHISIYVRRKKDESGS